MQQLHVIPWRVVFFKNECLEEDKKNKTFVLAFIHDKTWREELELVRWKGEKRSLSMAKLEEKNCWNWQDGEEKRERKENKIKMKLFSYNTLAHH